jgi:cyclophilin family peptidyl-prolyl cis-trans isomerase
MRMTLATTLAALLSLTAFGCGASSSEEGIVGQINELNLKTAEAVAQATDLDEFTAAMKNHDSRDSEIATKVQRLPASAQRELNATLGTKTEDSKNKLNLAIDKFHQKLEEGPNPVVLVETTKGPIKIELFEKLAPITVKNFLHYVDEKYYDGTIFHRVIPDFMIQGGGFLPGMKKEKQTAAPIKNESYNYVPNQRGTLAMARTGDPNSATAQFFVNVKDNGFLNRKEAQDRVGYAVFGKVVEGMDVVDRIKRVETSSVGPHENVPISDVVIESVRRVDSKEAKK